MSSLIVSTMIIMALAYILPGITVAGVWSAMAAAIVLGIANTLVRPVLNIFALPLNILTLGLFSFIVNGAMVSLTSALVTGFTVTGWWTPVIAAIIVSAANSALNNRSHSYRR